MRRYLELFGVYIQIRVKIMIEINDKFLTNFCQKLYEFENLVDNFTDKKPSNIFQQCRQSAGELGKFQLRDTVVLPFQRIVKYSLLLHVGGLIFEKNIKRFIIDFVICRQ